MRTTVTLDPDVAALLKQAMAKRDVSFKQAINDAIKAGLTSSHSNRHYETATFRMGKPEVPLTHAVRLAAEMEDEEIIRQLDTGK